MADPVDWDALAADVIANFEATGQWFASDAPPLPEPVDWDALAAQVQANFAATGQWFVGEIAGPGPAIIRASTSASGGQGNGASTRAVLSADGAKLAFSSEASNLVPGDTNGVEDVFVKDLATGAITWASTSARGEEGNGFSQLPWLSADGNKVAFDSVASNLVPDDTKEVRDVFVRDLGGAGFVSGLHAPFAPLTPAAATSPGADLVLV
jgi:hypothetical protein